MGEGLIDGLKTDLREMGAYASVPMLLWDRFSNRVLKAASALTALQAKVEELEKDTWYTEAHKRLDDLARERVYAAESRALKAEAMVKEMAEGREMAMKAVRLALPILDDDLASFRGDTPPGLWDARGFVCLDDLSCDHHRWGDCEAILTTLASIRDLLDPEEWERSTYVETQGAVEHFRPASALLSKAEAMVGGEQESGAHQDGGPGK
jgi:hypothetical protein